VNVYDLREQLGDLDRNVKILVIAPRHIYRVQLLDGLEDRASEFRVTPKKLPRSMSLRQVSHNANRIVFRLFQYS
jgi:hypothetical protein